MARFMGLRSLGVSRVLDNDMSNAMGKDVNASVHLLHEAVLIVGDVELVR